MSAAGSTQLPAPLVRTERLQVRYHAREGWIPATPLTLELQPGQTTLLVGPSGCGKSTLTLTINGLVPHSVPSDYRGSILVAGGEVADAGLPELVARTAMVMQDPDAQVVTGSVWDEVCYALQNACLPRQEIVERASGALQTMGLTHLATADPWQLSGGQRQRVLLAAALAQRPQLLVLDEPTANLDPAAAAAFYASLPSLQSGETTVLIVEHNLDHLIGGVDHVIALDKAGTVLAQGSARQVFGEQTDLLAEAGIRLPTATRVGALLGMRPLPLTASDLADAPPAAPTRARRAVEPGQTRQATSATEKDAQPPTVAATALNVSIGKNRVLTDVDFCAWQGEILAVLGVNGCGKSTLLRTLVGLQPFTCAAFEFQGRPVRRPRVHPLATLVTQNPEHQFVRNTVRDELAHSLRLAKRGEAEIAAQVDHLLAEYGLTDLAEAHPFTLSGGEKRRLSVAAALALPRQVLYLDEPTFGQDARNAGRLLSNMRALADQGTAVVMATHDLELVAEHADRVLLLAGGRVRAHAATRDVLTDLDALSDAGLCPAPLTQLSRLLRPGQPAWVRWADLPTAGAAA
ncbi:MAG: ATP-binding cassette domain-containing protein [Buchananella hordeovulneris]|nr:ATP-binding cassette domain-containing protein [Buchananella hordeovulneris]